MYDLDFEELEIGKDEFDAIKTTFKQINILVHPILDWVQVMNPFRNSFSFVKTILTAFRTK
jgi:hypothetical protein